MILRTLAVAALLLGGGAYYAGPPGDDTAPLDGAWALQVLEINGTKVSVEDYQSGKDMAARLEIKGTEYVFHLGSGEEEFTFKTNPSARPREIDLTQSSGPLKGQTFRGIYRVEADTFTICRHVEPGKDRPSGFATQPGSGLMLVVWKRLKS